MSHPLWAGIVGQPSAVALLQRAVTTDRVAHAYAFVGPSGVGRRLAALALAQACLCAGRGCGDCGACRRVAAGRHPDCHLVAPTTPKDNPRGAATLRIEQVRALMHDAALAPFEGPRKVFILDDADRLTLPAAQALLKTLEEPPPRTHLVLVLTHPRALPPTVLSRCQRVRFQPLGAAALGQLLAARGRDPDDGPLLARLCQGQAGLALGTDLAELRARRTAALELLDTPLPGLAARLDEARVDRDRPNVATLLEVYWLWYRDALCLAAGGAPALLVNVDRQDELAALVATTTPAALGRVLAEIKEAWLALEGNVSPRLALERVLVALAPRAA